MFYQKEMRNRNNLDKNTKYYENIYYDNVSINKDINLQQQKINRNNITNLYTPNNTAESSLVNLLHHIENEVSNESSINNISTTISEISIDPNVFSKLEQKMIQYINKKISQVLIQMRNQNALIKKRFQDLQCFRKTNKSSAYQSRSIYRSNQQRRNNTNSGRIKYSEKNASKRQPVSNIGKSLSKQKQKKLLLKTSLISKSSKNQILKNSESAYSSQFNNQISQQRRQLFNRNSVQNIMNTQSNNNVRQFQTFQQNNLTSTYEREENAFIQSRIKEQFVEQPNAQFLKRQKLCSDKFVSYLKMQWAYKKLPQKVSQSYLIKLFKLMHHSKLRKVNQSVILYALRLINACYPFDKLNVQSKLYAVQIILSHCLIKKIVPFNFCKFFDRLLEQETIYKMIQDFYDKYYDECIFYFGKDLISFSVRNYETKSGFKILQQQKYNKMINQLMIGYYFCKDEQQLCKLHYQEIADTIICYCLMLSHETQQCNRLKGLLLFKSSKAQIEVRFKLLEKGIEKYRIEMNYN